MVLAGPSWGEMNLQRSTYYPTSPTSTPNQHLEEKSTFVRLLFHRIVILAQGFSVKVPIANVSAKSTFWSQIDTFSMSGLGVVLGWSWRRFAVAPGTGPGTVPTCSKTFWNMLKCQTKNQSSTPSIKSKKQRKNEQTQRRNLMLRIMQLPIARPRRLLC